MDKKTDFEKSRERDRERDRGTDRERDRERERDRGSDRDRERERDRDRERENEREREKDNEKKRIPTNYSHSKSRSHSSHSYRNRGYDGGHYEKYYRRNSRSPRMKYRKKTSRDNSAENQGNVLYLSNLPRRIRNEEIKDRFEKFGKITDINIVREPFTKDSRGFGFVTYESSKSSQEAMNRLNKAEFDDKIINVEISKRSKPHKPTPGVYLGPKNDNFKRRHPPRREYGMRSLSRSRSRSYFKENSRSRSRSRRRHSRSRSRSTLYRHNRK